MGLPFVQLEAELVHSLYDYGFGKSQFLTVVKSVAG